MEEQSLRQQWIKLNGVRAWIANRLCGGSEISDNAMFEAQEAIGLAMLFLERAEYLTQKRAVDSTIDRDIDS